MALFERGRPLGAAGLALFLVVWDPLSFAATAAGAVSRLLLFGPPALALLAFRALVVGWGLAAGLALWQGAAHAIWMSRWWVVGRATGLVLTFLTPYFPSNQLARFKLPTLLVLLCLHALVWCWLRWSPRLRAAYLDDIRPSDDHQGDSGIGSSR
ncbi:MAG: hypothetical protein AB7I50_00855 [Vicinamibacterales bacterium]